MKDPSNIPMPERGRHQDDGRAAPIDLDTDHDGGEVRNPDRPYARLCAKIVVKAARDAVHGTPDEDPCADALRWIFSRGGTKRGPFALSLQQCCEAIHGLSPWTVRRVVREKRQSKLDE